MEPAAEFVKSWMKLTKEWNARLDEELAPRLTSSQLHVLEILREHAPMKPSDLLPHLETTPAAVTTLLDRMEKGGWGEGRRDEQDRRIVWVDMTEVGRAEAERGVRIRNDIVSRYLERLSAHNRQLLIYLLGKVSGVAGNTPEERTGGEAGAANRTAEPSTVQARAGDENRAPEMENSSGEDDGVSETPAPPAGPTFGPDAPAAGDPANPAGRSEASA